MLLLVKVENWVHFGRNVGRYPDLIHGTWYRAVIGSASAYSGDDSIGVSSHQNASTGFQRSGSPL
jgi:hypothetical protein